MPPGIDQQTLDAIDRITAVNTTLTQFIEQQSAVIQELIAERNALRVENAELHTALSLINPLLK